MTHENLDLEIRAWLGRYVRNEIDLATLQEWFATHTWNVHRFGNQMAADLAYSVDALLAQFSEGSFGERRLRSRLERYVDTYRFDYGPVEAHPAVSATDLPVIQRQPAVVGR